MRKLSPGMATALAIAAVAGQGRVLDAGDSQVPELRAAGETVRTTAKRAAQGLQMWREVQAADLMGWRRRSGPRRTFPGYGWSVAHDRRMAKKRRQVLKARRAKR